jgi:hypothetical protein
MTLEFEDPSTVSEGRVLRRRRGIAELVGILPITETVDGVGLEKIVFLRCVDEKEKSVYQHLLG